MAGEAVITNNKAVNKDAPKSIARRLKKSGVFFCSKRFERSEAVENKSAHGEPVELLERLERDSFENRAR